VQIGIASKSLDGIESRAYVDWTSHRLGKREAFRR